MTDELTRLPNRRHLFTVAHARPNDARRAGRPLSVLALDGDHFKSPLVAVPRDLSPVTRSSPPGLGAPPRQ
ncbi:MAG TPA: diguanylate cyclase [Longimicrobium sp.]